MGMSVLSDISVRASGRVIKNSTRGGAEFAIFNDETGSEYNEVAVKRRTDH